MNTPQVKDDAVAQSELNDGLGCDVRHRHEIIADLVAARKRIYDLELILQETQLSVNIEDWLNSSVYKTLGKKEQSGVTVRMWINENLSPVQAFVFGLETANKKMRVSNVKLTSGALDAPKPE